MLRPEKGAFQAGGRDFQGPGVGKQFFHVQGQADHARNFRALVHRDAGGQPVAVFLGGKRGGGGGSVHEDAGHGAARTDEFDAPQFQAERGGRRGGGFGDAAQKFFFGRAFGHAHTFHNKKGGPSSGHPIRPSLRSNMDVKKIVRPGRKKIFHCSAVI